MFDQWYEVVVIKLATITSPPGTPRIQSLLNCNRWWLRKEQSKFTGCSRIFDPLCCRKWWSQHRSWSLCRIDGQSTCHTRILQNMVHRLGYCRLVLWCRWGWTFLWGWGRGWKTPPRGCWHAHRLGRSAICKGWRRRWSFHSQFGLGWVCSQYPHTFNGRHRPWTRFLTLCRAILFVWDYWEYSSIIYILPWVLLIERSCLNPIPRDVCWLPICHPLNRYNHNKNNHEISHLANPVKRSPDTYPFLTWQSDSLYSPLRLCNLRESTRFFILITFSSSLSTS
jgi:hypothetical protein